MGNICFKGEDDGESNYLAGQRTNQGSSSRSEPVDRELLAAAAEKRLKANNERGIKTHTVQQQKSKADLPENMGEAALKWQVG